MSRSDNEGEPCPVCGWAIIREEHVPKNPNTDHAPHAPGTLYVHSIESTGNGKFRLEGCSKHQNGEKHPWQVGP